MNGLRLVAAAVLPAGQITVNNNSGTAGAYAPTGLTGGIVFPSGQGTSNHSNGMYLSSPSTSFAGNYTIEFWFNVDTLPSEGSGAYAPAVPLLLVTVICPSGKTAAVAAEVFD